MPSSIRVRNGVRGFSLIELLIVVAVIATLVGMIYPAIKIVRASAKTGQCANNQRQIFTNMMAYGANNQGFLPAGYWLNSSNQYASWDDQLCTYDSRDSLLSGTGNNTIGQCHLSIDATDPATYRAYAMYSCPMETAVIWSNGERKWPRSYAYPTGNQGTGRVRALAGSASVSAGLYFPVRPPNGGNYPDGNTTNCFDWSARTSQISDPANKILLAEIRYPNKGTLGGPWGVVVDGPGTQTGTQYRIDGLSWNSAYNSQITYGSSDSLTTEQKSPLHRGKWNYLFADGHSQLLLEAETNTANVNMWTR